VKDMADNECFPSTLTFQKDAEITEMRSAATAKPSKEVMRQRVIQGRSCQPRSTNRPSKMSGLLAMVVSSQYLELFQGYCQGESISRDKAELQLPLPLDLLHPDLGFSLSPMPHIPPLENSVNHVIPAAREIVVSIFHKM